MTCGTEPRSMGGAYFTNSKVDIANCTFNNNTGFGGAIYAEDSINNIFGSCFINNTLINYGHTFDIDCYTEGGACYFSNSNTTVTDCNFINNSAII